MNPSGLLLGILLGNGMRPEAYAGALGWCLDEDADAVYVGPCGGMTFDLAIHESC